MIKRIRFYKDSAPAVLGKPTHIVKQARHAGGAEIASGMFSLAELKNLEERHPAAKFYVHDGYEGWSYGSPQDPIPVTLETACQLLNILCLTRAEDGLRAELEQAPSVIEYTSENGSLYFATNKNRFLAFMKISSPKRLIPVDFRLQD